MLKQFTFSIAALVCFASPSFARHPFVSDPISDAPSVLIHTEAGAAVQAPAVEANVGAVSVQGENSADISADAPAVDASGGVIVESAPMSEPTRVYRYARPSRRSNNGLFGELIELERKKNAWIRRNVFGR